MINIPQNLQLQNLDIIIKYFFQYNNIVKTMSPRSNGLHTGHLAIMIAMAQMIPPHEHNNYYVNNIIMGIQSLSILCRSKL